MCRRIWFASKHDFACFENRPHDRRRHQVLFARSRERDLGRRGDTDVMTFCDVVDRHAPIEHRVNIVYTRVRRLTVSKPRRARVGGVSAGGDAECARCPLQCIARGSVGHGLRHATAAERVGATASQPFGALLDSQQHPPRHEKPQRLIQRRIGNQYSTANVSITRSIGPCGTSFLAGCAHSAFAQALPIAISQEFD